MGVRLTLVSCPRWVLLILVKMLDEPDADFRIGCFVCLRQQTRERKEKLKVRACIFWTLL